MLMTTATIVAAACAILGVAALIFRSNAVYMFLALCGGSVLADLAAQDVTQLLNGIVNINFPLYSYVQIVMLLILPVILLFMYRKSAGMSVIVHLLPAIAFVLLAFMFVTGMLPYDMQNNIKNSHIYTVTQPFYEAAIAAGMLVSLFYFWTKKPHHEKHGKKHK